MLRYSNQDLSLIRNRMIPTFDLTNGNLVNKIRAVQNLFPNIDEELIYGLMNPNYEQIIVNLIHNLTPELIFSDILRKYGKCLGNTYQEGKPIDPIFLTPIDYNDVIILSNTGYCSDSMTRMISTSMRNPIDNSNVNDLQLHSLEIGLAVSSYDYSNIMNPENYDEDYEDYDEERNEERNTSRRLFD